MHSQVQSIEALVDITYGMRPTVGADRIPRDNKIEAKGLREGQNKPFKLHSLPNPLIAKCIKSGPVKAFFLGGTQLFGCNTFHITIHPFSQHGDLASTRKPALHAE